jgi:hypothetical protein
MQRFSLEADFVAAGIQIVDAVRPLFLANFVFQ